MFQSMFYFLQEFIEVARVGRLGDAAEVAQFFYSEW